MKLVWATKKFLIVLLEHSIELLDNPGARPSRLLKMQLLLILIQITAQDAGQGCICLFAADNAIIHPTELKFHGGHRYPNKHAGFSWGGGQCL